MPDTKVVFEESQAGLNSAKLKTIADKADIIDFPANVNFRITA